MSIIGRNIRTIWTIPTESYPGAHFATYPRKLVEPCIKAGTSEKGCCPVCGAGWERVTDVIGQVKQKWGNGSATADNRIGAAGQLQPGLRHGTVNVKSTTGWRPACKCHIVSHSPFPPVPAVVLDPFSGSGTTGVVANALGRSYIGLDLNREYIGLAQRRIARPHAPIQRPERNENSRDLPGQLRMF